MTGVRLTASGGTALLGGRPLDAEVEESEGLPTEVSHALRQWAWVAGQVADAGEESSAREVPLEDAEAIAHRGQQLAALVAAVRGESVEYVDPISGDALPIGPDQWQDDDEEPTPWATGLTAAGFVALVMLGLDLALTGALRTAYGWIWIPANVLVGIGLAPTILLLSRLRFWRWISYGTTVGLTLAWLGLITTTL